MAQVAFLDEDKAFEGPVITFRPPDEGLVQVASAQLSSAAAEEEAQDIAVTPTSRLPVSEEFRLALPAYSRVHARLLHGDTLELSFRLTVKSRVRLLAQRHDATVASSPARVLDAGRHSLRLRLNVRRWPTKIHLQVRPLVALPTVAQTRGLDTVTTSSLVAPSSVLSSAIAIDPPGSGF